MSEIKKEKKTISQKLRQKYRFVLRDEENHEIVSSINLRVISVIFIIGSIIAVFYFFGFISAFFDPVREVFRTKEEVEMEEVIQLRERLKEMETIVEVQANYNASIQRLLTGGKMDEEDADSLMSSIENTQKILEETNKNSADSEVKVKDLEKNNFTERTISQMYLLPPVIGKVSSTFDSKIKHLGLDIVAPKNSAIIAITDGYVVYADWSLETGNTIVIQHESNVISIYKHNSMLLKKIGDFVKAGEAIAIIGNTGSLSSGPHLHFELWHQGKPLDAANYIKFD